MITGDPTIASRVFTLADQQWFAELSGDFNPMHLDPIAARRTPAGEPAVHGVHGLLWALDALSEQLDGIEIFGIDARFERFIPLQKPVTLHEVSRTERAMRVEIRLDGSVASIMLVKLMRGTESTQAPSGLPTAKVVSATVQPPAILDIDDVANLSGKILHAQPPGSYAAAFPRAAQLLDPRRLAALATCSRLVGMVCPGLHSVFLKLSAEFSDEPASDVGLNFTVRRADQRLRRVLIDVAASGLSGIVDCAVRWPPVAQPSMVELCGKVAPDAFQGATALVIGGSRGLGELTAKLVALGGGRTIITYATGRDDAQAVCNEIQASGLACEIRQFDFRHNSERQISDLRNIVTHLYYFASTRIFRQKTGFYTEELFNEFLAVYVTTFSDLCTALAQDKRPVTAFYPSSVFVAERPRGFTEYAMAKAAGEVLCSDIERYFPGIRVISERLPRLLTDQTATLTPTATAAIVETMLPIVCRVQLLTSHASQP